MVAASRRFFDRPNREWPLTGKFSARVYPGIASGHVKLHERADGQARKAVRLSKYDPDDTLGWHKGDKVDASLQKAIEKIDNLQYRLYAEHKRALLIILQGLEQPAKTALFAT